jgi:hypothetical protein
VRPLAGIPHGPHTPESIQKQFPALLPRQAVILALWLNQTGIGVPRATTPDPWATPQVVYLSPRRRFSNHRPIMAANQGTVGHA